MAARLDTLGARSVGTGCLEPGCETLWDWDHVMRYMPRGAPLEAYNIAMLDVWRHDSPIKPLTCLAPNCAAIGLPDFTAPGYPQVACHACAFRSCAQCLVPWHADVTCAERASLHVDAQMTGPERDTLKLVQEQDGKRCPNCQLVIEKDGGCDSMLCLGCQKYFNWATAGKFCFLKGLTCKLTCTTASAVPGAKKAMPFVRDNPYWIVQGDGTCEVDALQNEASAEGVAAA